MSIVSSIVNCSFAFFLPLFGVGEAPDSALRLLVVGGVVCEADGLDPCPDNRADLRVMMSEMDLMSREVKILQRKRI